jgi:hypothetical protein
VKSDRQYWFPAKRYGWGWGPPANWQGWTVLILWIFALFAGIMELGRGRPLAHVVFVAVMIVILLLVCWLKGQPPRWRWGK